MSFNVVVGKMEMCDVLNSQIVLDDIKLLL